MADKTLYDILEVSSGASPESIRAAYERLAAKHDPALPENSANPNARILHEAIKEAFLTLSNPDKRVKYDRSLTAATTGRMYNVEVVEPFWTVSKLIVLAVMVVFGGGYYYKHMKESARLEAEKTVAAAKAREAEEKAKAEAEQRQQAQIELQRQREAQMQDDRLRRERDASLA